VSGPGLGYDVLGHPRRQGLQPTLDANGSQAIRAWCVSQQVRCVYVLVDASDTMSIRAADTARFGLVDIRMTLTRSFGGAVSHGSLARGIRVRGNAPSDLPALRAIARVSYRQSRFYADAHFARQQCDALYETWTERSCAGYADQVLVAQRGMESVGYITCHIDGTIGRVGLVGVSGTAQGYGIGSTLVAEALAWLSGQGCTTVVVATQGRNIAAQRLFQSRGFQTSSVQLWYHGWFGCEGEPYGFA
jgi:dTDP-4-amino-4,6-dideoxy-D-galactose acyltransferase